MHNRSHKVSRATSDSVPALGSTVALCARLDFTNPQTKDCYYTGSCIIHRQLVLPSTDHCSLITPHSGNKTSTDSRTGTTTYSDFTEAGQARTTTSPAAEVTTTTLDRLGRPTAVKLPDDSFTYTSYHLSGQPAGKWGSLTNPTFTLYDDQGRIRELRTFQTLSGEPLETSTGEAKTTWNYSTSTGHLLNKKDHTEKGASYTYTDAGRLETRTWARSTLADQKVATYTYTHGLMTTTDYSDTTPDVTMEYDAIGRQKTLSNGVTTTLFDYDPTKLHLDKETITYNIPGQSAFTRVIDRSQDTIQRNTGYQLKNGSTPEHTVTYRYNTTSGRLGAVSAQTIGSSDTQDFIYGYENNSNLLKTTQSFTNYDFSTNAGTEIHQVTNTFETNRDVLLTKANTRASDDSTISSIGYIVNTIGQRTSATRSGAATNSTAWGYDALGQLTTANDSINDNDRAYQYDKIGNREKSANSLSLPSGNNYTANALNQYTAIGSLSPVYDDDGNATSYPVPTYSSANSTLVWDAENRKIAATVDGVTTIYYYDSQSRRIAHTIGSTATLYLYDTWNVIAEYTASGALTKTLTWGMDLSQSMQGAGGVGGLLALTEIPVSSAPVTYYPLYDGNGNITEYINQSATVVAHYEYDPFGNTTVASEAKANDFNYRFSTKPLDSATGFYYYGYRYYDPVTGRWPSRDPIEERGGVNLYGFVGNDGVNSWDYLGFHEERIRFAITEGGKAYAENSFSYDETSAPTKIRKTDRLGGETGAKTMLTKAGISEEFSWLIKDNVEIIVTDTTLVPSSWYKDYCYWEIKADVDLSLQVINTEGKKFNVSLSGKIPVLDLSVGGSFEFSFSDSTTSQQTATANAVSRTSLFKCDCWKEIGGEIQPPIVVK